MTLLSLRNSLRQQHLRHLVETKLNFHQHLLLLPQTYPLSLHPFFHLYAHKQLQILTVIHPFIPPSIPLPFLLPFTPAWLLLFQVPLPTNPHQVSCAVNPETLPLNGLFQPPPIPSFFPTNLSLSPSLGLMQLSDIMNSRSKDLTPTEFALAFSIYRDIICSVYPDRRTELDDYLSIILDMAVRFGGTGFYNYHVLFATQAAGR